VKSWSRMVTMNQFAVRSIGIGVAVTALLQLPVLASNRVPTHRGAVENSSASSQSFQLPVQANEPQLVAAALNSRLLRQGDEGTDVRLLQRYLSRIGLYPYVIDGIYGQETANAVTRYQRSRDLPATGIADETTLTDMNFDFLSSQSSSVQTPPPFRASPTVSAAPTTIRSNRLVFGSTGDDVVALQRRLNDFGIPVFVDGDYGFETQQAVRTYQSIQGLNVTGNADSTTLARMGFSASENRYIAAIVASESELDNVRTYFDGAYMDRARGGQFINVGNFAERYPAEARVDAASARGFNARVIYRRSGLFR